MILKLANERVIGAIADFALQGYEVDGASLVRIETDLSIEALSSGFWYYNRESSTLYQSIPSQVIKDRAQGTQMSKLQEEISLLRAQFAATIQNNQALEDCLVEMANVVYA
ncbi:MAG: hypothetical protein ABT01_00380 [Clostridium sp. SCN 57-10]|nr:MAG: hypothetical protein ABT01_00380 [Clostridium sp. SCN 57-10]